MYTYINFYTKNKDNNFLNDFRSNNRELFWAAVNCLQDWRERNEPQNAGRLNAFASVCDIIICSHPKSAFKERHLKNPQICLNKLIKTKGASCL